MQWGIHHHIATCKCQQKRDSLTLSQHWYQSWRECANPPCVLMPLSRSDQPSWPAHWPGSCQYLTHCLQWIPYTSIWCIPWAYCLAARPPWCSTPQGKLTLVCCGHPWSHHPGSALKWKTGSHEDELSHHGQVTWHTSCTCSHYSSHNQACYSPWSSQVHQVHWWLDKGVPGLIQGHWQIPWQVQGLTVMMPIMWYMPPGNAPSPYVQKSRNTLTRWNAWVWSSMLTNQWTGYPPLPTSRRQMVSYVCAWIPMTSTRPSAMTITRCPLWRKSLMNLHTLTSSPSWMPTMDTGQLSSTRTQACLWLSTVPLEDTISCDSLLTWSVPKTSSRRKWIRSLRNAKDVSESQTTSPSTAAPRQNMMPTYKTSCRLPANMIWCSTTENTCEGPSCQFLWLPLWCPWCPPRPGKGWCCTCLTGTNKHHQTSRVLRPSHIPKSLHPWSVHLDCPLQELLKKDTDFIWNHTYDVAFEWVKEAVISDTTLRYFGPSLLVPIQVDASQVGLGAALLQNGKPIAFASKALTETECWYVNIEREMLAAVFGAERFHT